MDNDWRLANQERYLFGKTLVKAKFEPIGLRDHAHCAFCWEKFGANSDWLQFGYCTTDQNWWICEQCFSDFCEKFQWILQSQ